MNLSRLQTKAIIMARSSMLDCATNYKHGYRTVTCKDCMVIDNENHRINECKKYSGINNYGLTDKFDFNDVFSESTDVLQCAAHVINSIWDLANGKNLMRHVSREIVIGT